MNRHLVQIVLNPGLVNHHPALVADAFLSLVEARGGTTRICNLHNHAAAPGSVAAQIEPYQRRAAAQIRALLGMQPVSLRVITGGRIPGVPNCGLAAHFAARMAPQNPGPDAA